MRWCRLLGPPLSVAFAHDIYEEWILERILRQRRGDIAQALREGGEDLQLVRPSQLLATVLLERSDGGGDWAELLAAVSEQGLRATWSRVVLAAPVRSARSDAMLDRVEPQLLRNEAQLLGRLVLSVRTTGTVRDLRFLDEGRTDFSLRRAKRPHPYGITSPFQNEQLLLNLCRSAKSRSFRERRRPRKAAIG